MDVEVKLLIKPELWKSMSGETKGRVKKWLSECECIITNELKGFHVEPLHTQEVDEC